MIYKIILLKINTNYNNNIKKINKKNIINCKDRAFNWIILMILNFIIFKFKNKIKLFKIIKLNFKNNQNLLMKFMILKVKKYLKI